MLDVVSKALVQFVLWQHAHDFHRPHPVAPPKQLVPPQDEPVRTCTPPIFPSIAYIAIAVGGDCAGVLLRSLMKSLALTFSSRGAFGCSLFILLLSRGCFIRGLSSAHSIGGAQ